MIYKRDFESALNLDSQTRQTIHLYYSFPTTFFSYWSMIQRKREIEVALTTAAGRVLRDFVVLPVRLSPGRSQVWRGFRSTEHSKDARRLAQEHVFFLTRFLVRFQRSVHVLQHVGPSLQLLCSRRGERNVVKHTFLAFG